MYAIMKIFIKSHPAETLDNTLSLLTLLIDNIKEMQTDQAHYHFKMKNLLILINKIGNNYFEKLKTYLITKKFDNEFFAEVFLNPQKINTLLKNLLKTEGTSEEEQEAKGILPKIQPSSQPKSSGFRKEESSPRISISSSTSSTTEEKASLKKSKPFSEAHSSFPMFKPKEKEESKEKAKSQSTQSSSTKTRKKK